MATPGDKIRSQRMRALPRLTQQELAERLGVTRSQLANYESGRSQPPKTVVQKLASIWNVPAEWFWDELNDASPSTSGLAAGMLRVRPAPMAKIPLRGYANMGDLYSVDPPSPDDPTDLDVPDHFGYRDYSGIVVHGDSMLPYLHPGDSLVFKDRPNLFLGRIILAEKDGVLVVKKAVWRDGEVYLESFNPAYKPMSAHGARCLGYLVGVIAANGTLYIGPDERGIDETYFQRELGARVGPG